MTWRSRNTLKWISLVFCFILGNQAGNTGPLDEWQLVSQTGYVTDVHFSENRFVAVSDTGELIHSLDGVYWRIERPWTNVSLNAVTRFGGRWLVAGNNGALFSSSDGLAWERASNIPTTNLHGFGHHQGELLLVGSGGTLLTSRNGLDWGTRQLPGARRMRSVESDGSLVVAVGEGGAILQSSNAVQWDVIRNASTNELYRVAAGAGKFVAVGARETIVTWETGASEAGLRRSGSSDTLRDVLFDGSRFHVVGENELEIKPLPLYSKNGLDWVQGVAERDNRNLALAFGNGTYVSMGRFGAQLRSTDGIRWVNSSIPGPILLEPAAAGGRMFITGYRRHLFESPDGQQWRGISLPVGRSSMSFMAIESGFLAYGNGAYVLAARDSGVSGICRSTNLVDWVFTPLQSIPGAGTINSVVFANGRFLAVGDEDTVMTSIDGSKWLVEKSRHLLDLKIVCHAAGRWVALGVADFAQYDRWIVLASGDGVHWTKMSSGSARSNRMFLAAGNSRFLFPDLGLSGAIQHSEPSLDWFSPNNDLGHWGSALSFCRGYFLDGYGLKLQSSDDGVLWQQHTIAPGTGEVFRLTGDSSSGRVAAVLSSADSKQLYISGVLPEMPPRCVSEAASSTVGTGDRVLWSARFASSEPMSYQWLLEGQPLPGETNHFFRRLEARVADSGTYVCQASNRLGVASSQPNRLKVHGTDLPLGTWHVRATQTQGLHLISLAAGLGLFVSVDRTGAAHVSTNGIRWTEVLPGQGRPWQRARFLNGRFFLVGRESGFAHSADGLTWETGRLAESVSLDDITFGDGVYVLVGDTGTIATSKDLRGWFKVPTFTPSGFHSVGFRNGVFAAVGDGSLILYSKGGAAWSKASVEFSRLGYGASDLIDLATNSSGWVAAGGEGAVYISTDGINWKREGVNLPLPGDYDLRFAVGLQREYLVGVPGAHIQSFSGSFRIPSTPNIQQSGFESMAVLNTEQYGVGAGGAVVNATFNASQPEAWNLRAVAANAERVVAVGLSGLIVHSTNGIDWVRASTGRTGALVDIEYWRGKFYAIELQKGLLASENGSDWKLVHDSWIGLSVASTSNTLAGASSSKFIASQDGEHWKTGDKPVLNGANLILRMTTFQDQFFGLNPSNMQLSTNGLDWTSVPTDFTRVKQIPELKNIFAAGDRLYALESAGNILHSTNGINWQPLFSMTHPDYPLAVAGHQQHRILVGRGGLLAYSEDGLNFSKRASGTAWDLHAATMFRDTFIVVGDYGTILQSAPVSGGEKPKAAPRIEARIVGELEVEVEVQGETSASYVLETTSELAPNAKWDPLPRLLGVKNLWRHPIAGPTGRTGFFRARLVED